MTCCGGCGSGQDSRTGGGRPPSNPGRGDRPRARQSRGAVRCGQALRGAHARRAPGGVHPRHPRQRGPRRQPLRPDRPGVVTLLTPASALGTEYEAVVIAGVQEGVWPNVRLRGGMLSAWRLSGPDAALLDRRRAALHDELRLFVRALTRARRLLVVTAVDDDDTGPSPFFSFLPEPPPASDHPSAEHPLTLRGLVMRHRRTLTTSSSEQERSEAAQQLAVLAREGVPGADPEEWYGMAAPSTQAPLRDLTAEAAHVSPSRMESFEECGLNWAVSALGGDTVLPPSAGIGTIVHEAMERVPDGDLERMRAILAEHWPELDFEAEWIGRKERRRADTYIDRLHGYLGDAARQGGRLIAGEVEFRFAVALEEADPEGENSVRAIGEGDAAAAQEAIIHGFIDRVEAYPSGAGEFPDARGNGWTGMGGDGERVVVVDLKTGKYEPETDAKVAENAQLAAYQIAVRHGLIDGADPAALAGARLLLVAKTLSRSDFRIAHQHRLDDDARTAFLRRVADAARGMSASSFTAHVEAHCADMQGRGKPCRIHTIPAVSA
ncbi:PD-(D/E)XK nuclease family protein [Microbacterium sp. NIBRBAC000506063]|nr:PD-(D/E)XK nuclease family protein [Microbacterium sp. NIBRBAC000506063]